jgi:hypothetical protein
MKMIRCDLFLAAAVNADKCDVACNHRGVMRGAVAVLLGLICAPALAQTVERIEIVKHGMYAGPSGEAIASPGTVAGVERQLAETKLIETTRTISARAGLRFGIEYRIVGEPAGGIISLKRTTIYPEGGVRNPSTGTTAMRDEAVEPHEVGAVNYSGFRFDDPWEMVPGIWTIELSHGGKTLASESFTVTNDAAKRQ